jgi:hypothetical protein
MVIETICTNIICKLGQKLYGVSIVWARDEIYCFCYYGMIIKQVDMSYSLYLIARMKIKDVE